MKNLVEKICSSRKWWYAVVAIIVMCFADRLGLSEEINNVVLIAIALILAQGLSDKSCKK